MTYIRTKVFEGRVYRYLVKGVRINGLVKQKVVKYIGPIKPIYKINKTRKPNASVYVRELNGNEKELLEKALHSSNAFTKDRAKIVLFSVQRLPSTKIAEKISCEVRKVRAAVRAFNKEGLKALERKKAKGAVPKFDKFDKSAILLHFSKGPREFGHPLSAWTLPRFTKHLIEKQVVKSISMEKVRQILQEKGAKLNKSKRWQYSPDKNFLKKRGR